MLDLRLFILFGLLATLLCVIVLNGISNDLDSYDGIMPQPHMILKSNLRKVPKNQHGSNLQIIEHRNLKKESVIDDEYCDYDNGLDELHTSACSHILVHNALFECKYDKNKKIFTSRINDGIRDCSDGSDEISILPDFNHWKLT
eukprot:gene9781-20342_t